MFPSPVNILQIWYVRVAPWNFLKVRCFYGAFRAANRIRGRRLDIRTAWGAYYADPADYAACHLAVAGVWEPGVTTAFQNLLGLGDRVIDVGGNFGYHTVLAAKLVGPSGRVHVFECSRGCLDLLRANVERNGVDRTVEIHDVAASDRDGTAAFYTKSDSGLGSLLPGGSAAATTVRTARLDNFDFDGRPALVKIDVEGGEFAVLRGMAGLLEKWRPAVICEVTGGRDDGGVFGLMRTFGYRAKVIPRPEKPYPPFNTAPPAELADFSGFGPGESQADLLFLPG